MMKDKIVYISGPYRAPSMNGIYENIALARRYALKYWKLGYPTICPHLNTGMFDGSCDDSVWLEGDIVLLKRCDIIVMIPGWKESQGAKLELSVAQTHKLHIIYEEE